MWSTSEIAKVLDGYMWPPKTDVVNRSEDDNISVHVDTKPRKCGCLLSKGAKQKKSPQTGSSTILVKLCGPRK